MGLLICVKTIMDRIPRSAHFATVYVTIVSVLLGLALEDLVSIVRELETMGIFEWACVLFVVHIILNAWVGFSSLAISLQLEPNPWDAANIFILSAAHFSLNSFVGSEPYLFFGAAGLYMLVAGTTLLYNVYRAAQDVESGVEIRSFYLLLFLNVWGGTSYLLFAYLALENITSQNVEAGIAIFSIPCATLWLWVFWRSWSSLSSRSAP